ncbi:GNAT family N-acetyltransferase [Shewanella yunxiaonensis]|uniref:GNAT family N-acetyltransferase n=1 Tax=Shewanella yunxiaonensis TaxID=2829809 RepID=A0ABX7YTG3_9GAMM|nr:GNAT family N-acetyltransferase [Shewanella yunxiaonensis]QUN06028.1 GNAT family N-acetyltransferase [Shewanella yunxiaonensis]
MTENLTIRIDDLESPQILALLQAHLEDMYATSPPESVHALDITKLKQPKIIFWSAWQQQQLLGCIALKLHDSQLAEIKSMRTTVAARRRGIASALLNHLLQHAAGLGVTRLCLETGSMAFFEPARALYLKFGFSECTPFADYQPDPNSVFMEKFLR